MELVEDARVLYGSGDEVMNQKLSFIMSVQCCWVWTGLDQKSQIRPVRDWDKTRLSENASEPETKPFKSGLKDQSRDQG